jgi:hypothetical protein
MRFMNLFFLQTSHIMEILRVNSRDLAGQFQAARGKASKSQTNSDAAARRTQ